MRKVEKGEGRKSEVGGGTQVVDWCVVRGAHSNAIEQLALSWSRMKLAYFAYLTLHTCQTAFPPQFPELQIPSS